MDQGPGSWFLLDSVVLVNSNHAPANATRRRLYRQPALFHTHGSSRATIVMAELDLRLLRRPKSFPTAFRNTSTLVQIA